MQQMQEENLIQKVLTPRETNDFSYDIPYIVDIKNNKSSICFIGAQHSFDPSDEAYNVARKYLKDFLSQHAISTVELAVESFIPNVDGDEGYMIKKFGESGFLAHFAKTHNLIIFCPEPSKEYGFLRCIERGYKTLDVSTWLFLNVLNSAVGENGKITTKGLDLLRWAIKYAQETIDFVSEDDILSNVSKHTDLQLSSKLEDFGQVFFDKENLKSWQTPYSTKSIFNDIGNEINHFRDQYIAGQILDKLNAGKNLFVLFGHNHAIAQEPVYRMFFNDNKGSQFPSHLN